MGVFVISVVIPAYNEENTIHRVLEETLSILKSLKIAFEILVINDGSSDKTVEVVASFPKVKLISHQFNRGYGAALKTGIRQAKGEYLLIMDADGQHYAEDIPRLLREKEQYDMIVGKRTKTTSLVRKPTKMAIEMFANYIAETKIPDLNSGFRLIRKSVAERFLGILPNSFSFTTTITLACFKEGYQVKYIPIHIKERKRGKSTIHPLKDTVRFFVLILRMTMLFSPLKVLLPVSILTFVVALSWLIHDIMLSNLSDPTVLLFIVSFLVFFFGLIADQLSLLGRQ
ncbi:glycosyltransferase family 2 protein [Candidatus Woesearchaeota archaeon]|nr:glycosyltransferase family 2 protein [Candidatus Woesearchaeota archaeon]